MIFVNFKAYEQSSGFNAVALAKMCEDVTRETHVKFIPVVQTLDAEIVINSVRSDVWVQHVDPISYGAHTGWTLPEEVVRVGAKGVFLNHSEHKFTDRESLKKAAERCKEVNLSTLIFADDLEELEYVLALKPDFASYEPPELVGSEETSVSKSKPEVVGQAAEACKRVGVPLIVGAGVKDKEDIKVSLDLGAIGFAIASSIVKSENPQKAMEILAEGYKVN